MKIQPQLAYLAATVALAGATLSCIDVNPHNRDAYPPVKLETTQTQAAMIRPGVTVNPALARDVSPPLASLALLADADKDHDVDAEQEEEELHSNVAAPQGRGGNQLTTQQARGVPEGSKAVEQTQAGTKPPPEITASFDGLGYGFEGPQGRGRGGNPSDNALAVGPDHIVQIVNSQMAVFTKKGARFDTTGKCLYGPVNTNRVFQGFGDPGRVNSGDAVVRYDQLADRWLIVMPIFSRLPANEVEPPAPKAGDPATRSWAAVPGQPGEALQLTPPPPATGPAATRGRGRGIARGTGPASQPRGHYAMCYAVSTTSDPLGTYYRYEFLRPLFPDYPRPAIWIDGYYNPTSTGDTVIQKQAFVADRAKMLKGEDATEQGLIIDGVNFLNNPDIDGKQLPPAGAPNIMMAAGGTQLKGILEDDGIYYWKFHVDWNDPGKTSLEGPTKITVAPYHYLGGGQLTRAVPQPDTENGPAPGLDSQGDKIMQRLVYRRIGNQESILATHSINTTAEGGAGGGGGVRWYEFRLDANRNPILYQQGTYCPGGNYRWMASACMDSLGNIGIGYSFGGTPYYAGQRFAARNPNDPLGVLTLHEAVLVEGQASQTPANRWQDYTTACMDPSDDRTIWYVGDYVKKGSATYSTKIGAFRIPGP